MFGHHCVFYASAACITKKHDIILSAETGVQTNIPIITKAVNIIYDLSEDTRIREIARIREKSLHDEASAPANARAEGRAEERTEIITNMKALGFTDEQINAVFSRNNP